MKSKAKYILIGSLLLAFLVIIFVQTNYHIQQNQNPITVKADTASEFKTIDLKNQIALLERELLIIKSKKINLPDQKNTELDNILVQLNSLQDQLDALREESDNLQDQPDNYSEIPIEEQIATEQQRTNEIVDFLSERFESEPTNNLNESLKQELEEVYVKNNMTSDPVIQQTQIQNFDCQTSLCRVEAHHDNPAAEQNFMMGLSQLNTFQNGEAFSQRIEKEDGSVETLSFISREGQRLPVIGPKMNDS
ncbi:MAG: hypothetical protein V4629_08410 [Pseudomonadota bacterium]